DNNDRFFRLLIFQRPILAGGILESELRHGARRFLGRFRVGSEEKERQRKHNRAERKPASHECLQFKKSDRSIENLPVVKPLGFSSAHASQRSHHYLERGCRAAEHRCMMASMLVPPTLQAELGYTYPAEVSMSDLHVYAEAEIPAKLAEHGL